MEAHEHSLVLRSEQSQEWSVMHLGGTQSPVDDAVTEIKPGLVVMQG